MVNGERGTMDDKRGTMNGNDERGRGTMNVNDEQGIMNVSGRNRTQMECTRTSKVSFVT